MNKLGKDALCHIGTFLKKRDIFSFRMCSKYTVLHISHFYFSQIIFNITTVFHEYNEKNKEQDKIAFREFVQRYSCLYKIIGVEPCHIPYIHTLAHNIKHMHYNEDKAHDKNVCSSIVLPDGIIDLELGWYFNKLVALPKTLHKLKFGFYFNQPIIKGYLPKQLTSLIFMRFRGEHFDFAALPASLTHLDFGNDFNQPIAPGSLPPLLTYLRFGIDYCRTIEAGVIPESVTTLIFNTHRFTKKTMLIKQNALPTGLKNLELGYGMNRLEYATLPLQLESLEFECNVDSKIDMSIFPNSLKTLKIRYDTHNQYDVLPCVIPQTVTSLVLQDLFNRNLDEYKLPSSLTSLKLSDNFNQPISTNQLPLSLTSLEFGNDFNSILQAKYPQMFQPQQRLSSSTVEGPLKALKMHPSFILPPTLTTLKFGYKFNQCLGHNILPSTLHTLILGQDFNQPIFANVLPPNLNTLIFGHNFNQPLPKDSLPASLRILKLGEKFNNYLGWDTLPVNLSFLKVVESVYPDKHNFSYLLDIPPTHKYLTIKIKSCNSKY